MKNTTTDALEWVDDLKMMMISYGLRDYDRLIVRYARDETLSSYEAGAACQAAAYDQTQKRHFGNCFTVPFCREFSEAVEAVRRGAVHGGR